MMSKTSSGSSTSRIKIFKETFPTAKQSDWIGCETSELNFMKRRPRHPLHSKSTLRLTQRIHASLMHKGGSHFCPGWFQRCNPHHNSACRENIPIGLSARSKNLMKQSDWIACEKSESNLMNRRPRHPLNSKKSVCLTQRIHASVMHKGGSHFCPTPGRKFFAISSFMKRRQMPPILSKFTISLR